jgi:hypothetical protein
MGVKRTMKDIVLDGVPGISLWPDDGSPLIAFKPHGSREWRYVLRPTRVHNDNVRSEWYSDYDKIGS